MNTDLSELLDASRSALEDDVFEEELCEVLDLFADNPQFLLDSAKKFEYFFLVDFLESDDPLTVDNRRWLIDCAIGVALDLMGLKEEHYILSTQVPSQPGLVRYKLIDGTVYTPL